MDVVTTSRFAVFMGALKMDSRAMCCS